MGAFFPAHGPVELGLAHAARPPIRGSAVGPGPCLHDRLGIVAIQHRSTGARSSPDMRSRIGCPPGIPGMGLRVRWKRPRPFWPERRPVLWDRSSWLAVRNVLAQAAGHLPIDVFSIADSVDYDALAF